MRIKINHQKETIKAKFEEYILEKRLEVSERTVHTYQNHFHVIGTLIDLNQELTEDVCKELYRKVNDLEISQASKNSYLRTWRAFINRVDDNLPSPSFKKHESIKATYTDEEIKKLTVPPKGNYQFYEYRNFIITLILADTGIRAASIRNMKVEDVQDHSIVIRHTKTHHVQVLPIGNYTAKHLHKYAKIVNGYEYLFPTVYGTKMTEQGLSDSMAHYNKARGVESTGIHKWRHTWAKNAINNGVDAFTVQKMLGHSSLETTKIYCRLFDSDLVNNYVSLLDSTIRTKIKKPTL